MKKIVIISILLVVFSTASYSTYRYGDSKKITCKTCKKAMRHMHKLGRGYAYPTETNLHEYFKNVRVKN